MFWFFRLFLMLRYAEKIFCISTLIKAIFWRIVLVVALHCFLGSRGLPEARNGPLVDGAEKFIPMSSNWDRTCPSSLIGLGSVVCKPTVQHGNEIQFSCDQKLIFFLSAVKRKPLGGTTLPEGDEIKDGGGIRKQKGRGMRGLRNKRRRKGMKEKRGSRRGGHEKLSNKYSLS